MKILDIPKVHVVQNRYDDEFWEARMFVLGDGQPGPGAYTHVHQWNTTCVEWRIAEYNMDPADIDSVLHLILHEHLLTARTEVTCYTPGYDQAGALAHRLNQIQEHIDRHAARMTEEHKKRAKHLPHKHPTLNPVRELGVRDEILHPRRLFVEGVMAKREGRKNYAAGKLQEAHALLVAEHQGKKGPWQIKTQ